jgi:pimeloyl-ACP methyl ester carboxylesterase
LVAQVQGRAGGFRHEPGRAPTLIAVHGSADNHHVYDPLLDALEGRARYAISLPGRAGTDGPPLAAVAEMEAFLDDVVAREVEGEYWVLGHSLGGAVAIEHALRSSPQLRGIGLLATGARLRVHPMILQLFEQVKQSGKKIPPLPPGLYEPGADPALVEKAAADRELTPIETGEADWRAADGFDRMGDLARIQVPALIVAGTHDALTPAKYAEYLAANIRQSELHVIEGAGHMLVLERAAQIARWIDAFVERPKA